jgi:hypothetical protein
VFEKPTELLKAPPDKPETTRVRSVSEAGDQDPVIAPAYLRRGEL